MSAFKAVTVSIAVSRDRAHTGDPNVWRVYIDDDLTEHPVREFKIEGLASHENLRSVTFTERDPRGILACIVCIGDIELSDDIAHITLR